VWSHPKMPTGMRVWRIPLPALRLRSQGALHVRPYREVALRRHHSPTLLSTVWWLFLGLGTHHHDPHTPKAETCGFLWRRGRTRWFTWDPGEIAIHPTPPYLRLIFQGPGYVP
jgi:hypothetical protein